MKFLEARPCAGLFFELVPACSLSPTFPVVKAYLDLEGGYAIRIEQTVNMVKDNGVEI